MSKKGITYLKIVVFVTICFYLCGAFICADLNIKLWNPDYRLGIGIFWCIVVFCTAPIFFNPDDV